MDATPSVIDRLSFYALLVFASSLFWLSPHPPLVDLPQHAAQIAGLRDMIRGEFKWNDLAEFQLLTPYYLSYGTGALFALIMPVHAALSLTLNLAFLAFIWGCLSLRRLFDGDYRLDVLFIPGFFAFSWQLGLTSYLIATPLALFFIALTVEYARSPNLKSGFKMAGMGVALFLSHALAGLFGGIFAGFYLLFHERQHLPRLIKLSWPFIPMALLFVFFYWVKMDDLHAEHNFISDLSWFRIPQILTGQVWAGISPEESSSLIDNLLACSIACIFCLPFFMSQFKCFQQSYRAVLFTVAILIWLLMPVRLLNVDSMYERISTFLLPFFLLMFGYNPNISSRNLLRWVPHVCCGTIILMNAQLIKNFAAESSGFEAVLEIMEPNQRSLYIPFYKDSEAINKRHVYWHHGVWYQAEKGGWVDFNYAANPPHLIKFRPEKLPDIGADLLAQPYFDWKKLKAWNYRYYLLRVRPSEPLAQTTARFAGGPCEVSLVIQIDPWRLYERGACQALAIDRP